MAQKNISNIFSNILKMKYDVKMISKIDSKLKILADLYKEPNIKVIIFDD